MNLDRAINRRARRPAGDGRRRRDHAQDAAAAAKAEPVVLEGRPEPRRAARRLLQGRSAPDARRQVRHVARLRRRSCASSRPSIPAMQTGGREAVGELDRRDRRRRRAARRKKSDAPQDEKNPLQAALLAMDPDNGEVRALVGGRASARAVSIARRRRVGSRAPPSSRSSTPLRSSRAGRRPRSSIVSTSRSRRCRATGCPRTSTSTRRS